MRPTFGTTLRALRKDLRLTQEGLAGTLGTTQRHVSFLETGRSAPTRAMMGRLVTGLGLSAAQRAMLFEASGFRNPYPTRRREAGELEATLDLLERQLLRHWPFPAFLTDLDWTFLRWNEPGGRMLEMFDGPPNMFSMFLSEPFHAVTENWVEASASLYYRIRKMAERSELVRTAFEDAVAAGRFAHVDTVLAGTDDVPVYVPIVLRLPDGRRLTVSSMCGNMVSVHDAVAEDFTVELMVPLDDATEAPLLEMFGP